MLAGIYYGSQYGGTITSVLISTPGEASSVVTTLDGYQMARRVGPGAALAIAAIGSFVAAIISLALLVRWRRRSPSSHCSFGPPEMLADDDPRPGHDRQLPGDDRMRGPCSWRSSAC